MMSTIYAFFYVACCLVYKVNSNSADAPIIEGNASVEIEEGSTLYLNCSKDGAATLEWYFNGEPVTFEHGIPNGHITRGRQGNAATSELVKHGMQSANSGTYSCTLENGASPANVSVTVIGVSPGTSTSRPKPVLSMFSNIKNLHEAVVRQVGGLLEVANAHEFRINDLDAFIYLQYEKLEKWLSDMQTRIKLDHAETVETVEGHESKLQDLSSQLDAHQSKLNGQLRQIERLETLSLPGANLGREIETLRRDIYDIQSQQLVFNQTANVLMEQLKSIKEIVAYIEKKIDEPEMLFCEADSECPDTHYCSFTTKGNICELKSPPGTFCLRSNKCQSGSCNWLRKCD